MDLEIRLVCQARSNYPSGIYSGTDRKYVLQVRVPGDRWHACPIVDWDEMTQQEQEELANDLKPPAPSAAGES